MTFESWLSWRRATHPAAFERPEVREAVDRMRELVGVVAARRGEPGVGSQGEKNGIL